MGVLAAAIGVIPQWRGEFFYYVGDAPEQYTPLWHVFGEQLRAGQWPTMDPAGWLGGNYAAEAMTGLWNPVNLLDYLLVSTFDNLSLAAFVVMVQFLGILAMGVFLLAREYGAGRVPAVLVAIAVPVSGFTLWYEASGWPAGLMAFTWVTHFWWSSRRHARGELNPLVPFLFGGLTITVGNPYGALGVLVVSVAIGVELLLQRRWARLAPSRSWPAASRRWPRWSSSRCWAPTRSPPARSSPTSPTTRSWCPTSATSPRAARPPTRPRCSTGAAR